MDKNKKVREIFAQRLRQARTKAQLSMDELCHRMDGIVSRQAIFKYENGEMLPDSTRLMKICNVLGQDIDFFFRPFTFNVDTENISFRKTSIKGKKLNALKVTIQDAVERYLEIDDILGSEKAKGKPIKRHKETLSTLQDMEECARIVREAWGVGAKLPIFNTQLLLMQHGIDVIVCEGVDKFDGVSLVAYDRPIIVLNNIVNQAERRRFTTMHELGHLLFNNYMTEELDIKQREKMCHAFASEMLLPTQVIKDLFQGTRNVSLEELYYLQSIYGISVEAIMYKLRDINIVTDKRYRSFNIIKNKSNLKEEINLSRYTEELTQVFDVKVYRALAQNLITESKASSLLKLPLAEVHNKVNAI